MKPLALVLSILLIQSLCGILTGCEAIRDRIVNVGPQR